MGKFNENRNKTLTQADFARRLAGSTGELLKDADFWTRAVRDEIITCLLDGMSIKIEGIGTLELRQRAARKQPHNAILGGREGVTKETTVAHLKPSRMLNKLLTRASESREGAAR